MAAVRRGSIFVLGLDFWPNATVDLLVEAIPDFSKAHAIWAQTNNRPPRRMLGLMPMSLSMLNARRGKQLNGQI